MASINAQDFYRRKTQELIKGFEGFRDKAYLDGMNIPTIGYGATHHADGSPVRMGDSITPQAADELFDHHYQTTVESLNQNDAFRQLDPATQGALTSFSFNVGPNFIGHKNFSSITSAIESGDKTQIANAMNLYVNPGTSTEAGLRRRRTAEIGLMNTPYMSRNPYESGSNMSPNPYK